MPSEINVVLGTASFGRGTTSGMSTLSDEKAIQAILDLFKKHGGYELDNARVYGSGTSEELLGSLKYEEQGFKQDTKVPAFAPSTLTAEKVHKSVQESIDALQTKKVHILYLHGPDSATPLEETLAVNEEYKKGRFEKFGISNFSAEDVEKAVKISKERGYVAPTVYQGMYNLLARGGEDTLFPVLRKHGIAFFAYSPLAGSLLTDSDASTLDRFTNTGMVGQLYNGYYNKESHHKALATLKEAAKKHSTTISDVALRWLNHHSALKRAHNDGIITGGKNIDRIETTLKSLEQGPLPQDLVDLIEQTWKSIRHDAAPYHF